jgi:hypothetical protein
MVSSFKALPSPIFGGDMYYQLGVIEHILAGGNPLDSSSIIGGMPGYLPLYALLVSAFSLLFGLDAFHGQIYFSIIAAFLMPIIWFALIKKLVKDEWIAAIGCILSILVIYNPLGFPIIKYTDFTRLIMFPIFLYFLYETYRTFNIKNAAFLAFFYSILTISHMVVFVSATIILGFFFLYALLVAYKGKTDFVELVKRNWQAAMVFIIIALPLLMLYWYKPLFVYHLKMPYDRTHMDVPDFANPDVQMWFVFDTFSTTFLNFSSIGSLFFIFSIVFFAKNIKSVSTDETLRFLTILLAAATFATFSYFLTEPLLHINFICTYIVDILFKPSIFLLGVYFLDKLDISKRIGDAAWVVYPLAIIVLLLLIFSGAEAMQKANPFFKAAQTPLHPYLKSLAAYIKQNTSVNDVFLTTKELGFMINALTGRKLVTNRWAHQNDPYTNMPQRDIDAAIMLYGNNNAERRELLKSYNVSYLYWDVNWIFTEYQRTPQGQINLFDPLITLDTPSARAAFYSNGIKFVNTETWLDPAIKFWYIRQYPILIVSPENYRSFERPWNEGLDNYIKEVWSYSEGGQKIAVLYKVIDKD